MKVMFIYLYFNIGVFMFSQNSFNNYFDRGQEMYLKGNYSQSIREFNNALKHRKMAKDEYLIANAYRIRALCKMELKQYNFAIDDISDAIKLKPEYSELYFTRSIIHLRSSQYDDCITWANKGIELKPEFEDLILIKIRAKIEKKNYNEALNDIDTILLKINPKSVEAWNLKGSAMQYQKDFKGGIEAFTKAIEIDAQNFGAFYNRGICRARMKNFDGAQTDMTRGMEIDSTQKWIGYNNIAYFINFEQKDFKGSLSFFDKAIKMNPKFAYAYCNRGYAKLQLKDYKGANEDISKSINLDDKNPYAYKTYAQLLIAETKFKQACIKLKKAIELGYTEKYDDEVNELIKEYCK